MKYFLIILSFASCCGKSDYSLHPIEVTYQDNTKDTIIGCHPLLDNGDLWINRDGGNTRNVSASSVKTFKILN